MNEKLKKLLDSINAKKAEVKALAEEGKIEEAKAAKAELVDLQARFDLLYDLDEDEQAQAQAQAASGGGHDPQPKNKEKPTYKDTVKAFVNAIRCGLKQRPVPEEDTEVLNLMTEAEMDGDGESDGGLTVPQDIQTTIKELRRAEMDDLELYVNVETVATLSGSRPIESEADSTPWPDVDEGGEFTEEETPKMHKLDYKVTKKGGILKITEELLQDTAENIMGFLNKWIAKKSRATRNHRILAALSTITTGKEVTVNSLDDLKKIFNIVLDPAISEGSMVLTNQTGYNWLDTLKDKNGDYVLQPDPTDKTKDLLFGKYPVKKLSDKVLKNKAVEGGVAAPLICGDPKEAITLFDREKMTVDISSTAGELWKTDKTGIKVRDRFDVKPVDEGAIVRGEVTIANAG